MKNLIMKINQVSKSGSSQLGLTSFALVSLLLLSQSRAQAQLIHEHADWPAQTTATSPCKRLPFTVTGPGRLTIRLKMNPYYYRTFTNRGENVVEAEALPYIASGKGMTINGLPNQDPRTWLGKPVDIISTWEFNSGKGSAEIVFCPPVNCGGSGCSQLAATAELIVDWTDGNTAPAGNESVLFNSMNDYGVGNDPTVPAKFTLSQPHLITSIMNYHWNNGRGTRVGTIGLEDAAGRIYGPWPVKGTAGQGGVPNVYWTATPNVKLPAGAYTIIDSEPSTWSQNEQSRGSGIGLVKGYPATSPTVETSGTKEQIVSDNTDRPGADYRDKSCISFVVAILLGALGGRRPRQRDPGDRAGRG